MALMLKVFCPTCKFPIFSDKRTSGGKYRFTCTCKTTFVLDPKFAKSK